MSTNSADPTHLVGFCQSIDGVTAAAAPFIEQAAWAMARYRSDCAELPADSGAVSRAADALDSVRALSGHVRDVAAAFEAADRGHGAGGVRTVDDTTFANVLTAVVLRQRAVAGDVDLPTGADGVGTTTERGLVVDGDRDLTLGPDGLTGSLVGSILYGYRETFSADQRFGPVDSHHELEVTAGAEAAAEISATVGPDGADLQAEAEAFVGGKLEATSSWSLGPCTAEVEATAAAGAGVAGELDAHVGRDGFTVDAGLLATLGVGTGVGGSLSCQAPSWDDAEDWFADRGEDVGEAISDFGGAVGDLGEGVKDGISTIGDWVGW